MTIMSAPDHILSEEERFLIYLNYLQESKRANYRFNPNANAKRLLEEYELYDTERRTHTWTPNLRISHCHCRRKSLSKAAERLYLSQPALSQRLKKLEDELGTPLFLREKNGLSITDAGESISMGHILSCRSSGKP